MESNKRISGNDIEIFQRLEKIEQQLKEILEAIADVQKT